MKETKVGTPLYIAPEQEKSSNYDYKVDIYSIGILLFEILNHFKTGHSRIKEITLLKNEAKVREDFR